MLKETLLTTQKVTDELKSNARREAELLLADAGLRAEKVVLAAEEQRLELVNEIREIKRQRIDFESSLRALLDKHLRMLDLDVRDTGVVSSAPAAAPEQKTVAPPTEPPVSRQAVDHEIPFDIPLVDDSGRKPLP